MRRKKDREFDVFSLSFLDCICCGFGAVILLFVLSKAGEPVVIEQVKEDLSGLIKKLEAETYELRGEVTVLNRELKGKQEQLSEEKKSLARLQGDLSKIQGEFAASKDMQEVQNIIEGKLAPLKQQLTEEMKRLLAQANRPVQQDLSKQPVGGIPVDSEYIVFIIDTSGSMKNGAWPMVIKKLEETLKLYPKVRGIQVMNDMGQYLYPGYAGQWIPDTPGRRRALLNAIITWQSFSNSSPVEGINEAIRRYANDENNISIYVYGDEFSGRNMFGVLEQVDYMNRRPDGSLRARIHAVGFPTVVTAPVNRGNTGVLFAILMRELCARNGGTFVALPRAK